MMIAADTSVLINYFKGIDHPKTILVDEALQCHTLVLPPVVIAEICSDSSLPVKFLNKILELPFLEVLEGYWQRAGMNRAKLISKKFKARLADTLIAQSCIDHQIPLITCDTDFRHFVKYCQLILL
ncbi:MAG: PIN domain-containing protein [Gammaproteobacteria bacterium]